MKIKIILALCISAVCILSTGCGDDSENILRSKEETKVTVTSETKNKAETTSKTTEKNKTDKKETKKSESETETVLSTAAENTPVETSIASDGGQETQAPAAAQETQPADNVQVTKKEETPAPPVTAASFEESDFKFTYNGHSVTVGEKINGFTDSVAPDSELTSPSCMRNGEDIIYKYSSFDIYAYKVPSGIYVVGVDLTGKDVSTAKNIKLGSSLSDLTNAYGTGYAQQGSDYVYSIGSRNIRVTVSSDKVTALSYNSDSDIE